MVVSKKLKLEHLPMRRNPDRKSQKKKKKKPREYLKQQQITGIIVLLFVLVTDSWNDVKKKKISGSTQEKFIHCYTTHQ